MSQENLHTHTLDVTRARRELARLYDQVAQGRRRVEITRRGSHETCVMISKEELESLERALEILSDNDGIKSVEQSLAQLAAANPQGPFASA